MSNETQMTEEQQLKIDASMGQKLYSIRAKFYDRYNVKRDIDYDIKDLIFSKLDELEKELQSAELRIKESEEQRLNDKESILSLNKSCKEAITELQSLKEKLTVEKLALLMTRTNPYLKNKSDYEVKSSILYGATKEYAQALIKELTK